VNTNGSMSTSTSVGSSGTTTLRLRPMQSASCSRHPLRTRRTSAGPSVRRLPRAPA
jgi:hypothetical protein